MLHIGELPYWDPTKYRGGFGVLNTKGEGSSLHALSVSSERGGSAGGWPPHPVKGFSAGP